MQSLPPSGRPSDLADRLTARPILAYAFAVGIFLLALGVRFRLMNNLPPGLPFITFIPAVMITAYFAGRGPAIFVALASGISAWLLFVPPQHQLSIFTPVFLALIFYLFVVLLAISLIHRLRQTARILDQERATNALLAEQRAFLFGELQHRVANNMAFLVAILSMQKSEMRRHPRASEEVLDDAIRRIRLFSSIHRRLHDPDSATGSLDAHFKGLFADLVDATGARHIQCHVETSGLKISGETLMTLSLISTELMTNAIKHAFPTAEVGEVSIYLGRSGSDLLFIVSDNGVGKSDAANPNAGLGCTIVEALCEQLGAGLTIYVDHGTHIEIRFPDPSA